MAELTKLESKLAEVLGLAQASQAATKKVKGMLEDGEEFGELLQRMHDEASETEERCTALAGELDGKKTAILEQALETKQSATKMMSTYLEGEDDALDGFEFLTMAEAGEVGHWSIVAKFNEQTNQDGVQELVDWALPIQEKHFKAALDASLALAGREDAEEIEA
jgi:flagellar hook-basal body complex protein FliE